MPGPYGAYVTLDELPPLPGDTIQLSDLLLARRLSSDYRFTGAVLKAFIASTMDEIYPVDFEVGSVVTVAPGQPATVGLFEVDPTRWRFNFGLPQAAASQEVFYQPADPVVTYPAINFKTGYFPAHPTVPAMTVFKP